MSELPRTGEWSLDDIRAHLPDEVTGQWHWADRAIKRLCSAYESIKNAGQLLAQSEDAALRKAQEWKESFHQAKALEKAAIEKWQRYKKERDEARVSLESALQEAAYLNNKLVDERLKTTAKSQKLVEALKFYGTKQEWGFYCGCCADGSTPLEMDHGKRADDAIAEYEGSK